MRSASSRRRGSPSHHLHAAVPRIEDVEISVGPEIEAPGVDELARLATAATPRADGPAVACHVHETVVAIIRDGECAVGKHGHIIRETEVSGTVAKLAECAEEFAGARVVADAMVAGIGNPQDSLAIEREALRPSGPAFGLVAACEGEDELALRRELLNPIIAAVFTDVDEIIGVERDVRGPDELARRLAVFAETQQLMSIPVVFDDAVIMRVGDPDAVVPVNAKPRGLALFPFGHAPLGFVRTIGRETLDAGGFVHDEQAIVHRRYRDATRILKFAAAHPDAAEHALDSRGRTRVRGTAGE